MPQDEAVVDSSDGHTEQQLDQVESSAVSPSLVDSKQAWIQVLSTAFGWFNTW